MQEIFEIMERIGFPIWSVVVLILLWKGYAVIKELHTGLAKQIEGVSKQLTSFRLEVENRLTRVETRQGDDG